MFKSIIQLITILFISMLLWQCDPIDPPVNPDDVSENTCEGCHTSKRTLEGIIADLHLDEHDEEGEAPG